MPHPVLRSIRTSQRSVRKFTATMTDLSLAHPNHEMSERGFHSKKDRQPGSIPADHLLAVQSESAVSRNLTRTRPYTVPASHSAGLTQYSEAS